LEELPLSDEAAAGFSPPLFELLLLESEPLPDSADLPEPFPLLFA
jgi:hypothetical protein